MFEHFVGRQVTQRGVGGVGDLLARCLEFLLDVDDKVANGIEDGELIGREGGVTRIERRIGQGGVSLEDGNHGLSFVRRCFLVEGIEAIATFDGGIGKPAGASTRVLRGSG